MKTKLQSFVTVLVATVITALGLQLALAQDPPPFAQLVSNVVHFAQPKEGWTVTVNQTLTPPVTNTAAVGVASASAVQTQTVETFDSTFETTFVPAKREWVAQRAILQTPKAAGTNQPATNTPPGQPSVRITVDMAAFLESLLPSTEVSVVPEALDGRTCYKIDAKSGADRLATLWVEGQRWHVSKSVLYLSNRKFAEVSCEYRDVNGRWLTSKSVIDFAFDGSRAVLDFGEYKRAAVEPK